MRLLLIGALVLLQLLASVARADNEVGHYRANSTIVTLGDNLKLQLNDDHVPLMVQADGSAYFQLEVPDLGEEFFRRHHLQINIPYLSAGYRKNQYFEVSQAGTMTVRLPTEEPPGTPIYLYNGERRFVRSTAERVITPIAQFYAVYQMLGYVGGFSESPYGASIDFKRGGFLEGAQAYMVLDSSLRFARDAGEHLEIYYQMNPAGSSMTVTIICAVGALILKDVPIDPERYSALAMQRSFINSAMMGKLLESTDESLITAKFSEKLFPSHGSVRNFRSKLASQMVRGPVLTAGLMTLDQEYLSRSQRIIDKLAETKTVEDDNFEPLTNWLSVKKLMIKSASETRQFNEMVGANLEGVPSRVAEWGLNGVTFAMTGIDGPTGSLKQTFADEFQQQMGSHTHKQVKEYKDKRINPLLFKNQPEAHLILNQIFVDFSIGGLFYFAGHSIDMKMGGTGMFSRRYGKGLGLSYAMRTIGSCAIEWLSSCATNFVHDLVSEVAPSVAPFFRRDLLLVIDHGLTPEPETKSDLGLRSHAIHDEL